LERCETMLGSGVGMPGDVTPASGVTFNQSFTPEPSESSQSVRPRSPISRMGSAVVRAVSGSPVAAFVMGGSRRQKQNIQQPDEVTTPSSASTSAWGGSTTTGRGRSNLGDDSLENPAPASRRPIERTQSASVGKWFTKPIDPGNAGGGSNGVDRRSSVPATLLGHLYPRRVGGGSSDAASSSASTRTPKLTLGSRNVGGGGGGAGGRGVARGR